MKKPFSWKSVSIYLTIILFLVLIIQFSDSSKRGDRASKYIDAIESSYNELLIFQQSILDGKITVDANKEVIKMAEKNLLTQLGTFIDFFGDQKEDDERLFDYYTTINKYLKAFYEADTVAQQQEAFDSLQALHPQFQAFLTKIK